MDLGNTTREAHVRDYMAPHAARAVHMADVAWTAGRNACDPVVMAVADPLLVVRRHVDLLRVHSAMCRAAR